MPSSRSRSSRSKSPSSSSYSGSDEEWNTVASMRKRKRRSSKKSRGKNKKPKSEFDGFRRFAHWHIRSGHTFIDYCNAFTYGVCYEAKQFGNLTRDKFAAKYALDLETFFAMKDGILSFDKVLSEFKKLKPDLLSERLNELGRLMIDAAGSARGNDIKGLLDKGLAYLALDLPNKELEPTIPSTAVKDQTRGHNHIVLSRLLTPVRLLEDFDKNADEYRKKILRGAIKFNDEDFPSLLYPQPDGYDPEDLEANLLRNHTAVRFFKHIFTSPSSAIRDLGTKPKRRTGQAKLNNMTEVTPASIAYSYLMFWYNISAIGDWRADDDLMDRSELYLMIVRLFEECENDDEATIQWRKDTLDWWNFAVFGILPDKSDDENDDLLKATTLQLLCAQRAQKAAAAAAAEASTANSSLTPSADPAASSSEPSIPLEATPTLPTTSSGPAPDLLTPQHSSPPSSPFQSLSFPPVYIPQVVTPPRSSPVPNISHSASRQPLTSARHANISGHSEASPLPCPVKYSRKGNHASASSTDLHSRR